MYKKSQIPAGNTEHGHNQCAFLHKTIKGSQIELKVKGEELRIKYSFLGLLTEAEDVRQIMGNPLDQASTQIPERQPRGTPGWWNIQSAS